MDRSQLLEFALEELDRLSTASSGIAAVLPRMQHAAHDPVLGFVLTDRMVAQLGVRNEVSMIYADLYRDPNEVSDPLVVQLCRQAVEARNLEDRVLRDMEIARIALAIDRWQLAVCGGLSTLFRQLYQDPAADSLDRASATIRVVSKRLKMLQPSLTGLHRDEERHGHETRSPQARMSQNQLSRLVLAGIGRER
ncbi:MAG: hypothetical protein EP330_16390 [Deltaproteobacteria bacterium]|nr:MAG: hypothetical protein EP330_16390 [Deltaproteobacteria bacterium]